METLREEQDVVVCHHCHCKVQVVDIINDGGALSIDAFDDVLGNSDDEMNELEQMAGEELAAWMGVGDNLEEQRRKMQTGKEIAGVSSRGQSKAEVF